MKAESLKLYWKFTGFYSKKAPWYSGGANASIFSKIGLKLQKPCFGQSGLWSLKLTNPQKSVDEINLSFCILLQIHAD